MHKTKDQLTSIPPPASDAPSDAFSPLLLSDRVVIMALFYEIVEEVQVARAWSSWRSQPPSRGEAEPLWRVLVRDPEVNREAVFEVAAQLYGFEPATLEPATAHRLLTDLKRVFDETQWAQMASLVVLPVAVGADPRTGAARLVFASPDPTRAEVTRLLQGLELPSFELTYAPTATLTELLAEAFCDRRTAEVLRADVPRPAPAPMATPRRPRPDEADGPSLIDWFEQVLVSTFRQEASETHIAFRSGEPLELSLRIGGTLRPWRTEAAILSEGLVAYLMDSVIKVDSFGDSDVLETTFQRWIDSDLARFHLALKLDADRHDVLAGTAVIRIIGHREAQTDAKGMGPWMPH